MSNKSISDKKLIDSFVTSYINYVNPDIFKAMHFLKKNNVKFALDEINALKNRITENAKNYLSNIIENYSPEKITRIGDMHRSNKCTLLLEKENIKFIYKPVKCDFLKLINEIFYIFNQTNNFNFYMLKILSSNADGSLVEFIRNEDIKDIDKFSYHYGAIIFILTLLRGTDFHSDNIFSVSSTPVIIDFETLFYPIIKGLKDYDVTATSLIKTKMNTHTIMGAHKLNNQLIIKGIESAYKIIELNKNRIAQLINEYHGKLTRIILKPTSYYLALLKKSTHPLLLITSTERENYLQKSLTGKRSLSSVLIQHELEDLTGFDIPFFYYYGGSLYSSKNILIKQNFISSPLSLMLNELKNLYQFKERLIETFISADPDTSILNHKYE